MKILTRENKDIKKEDVIRIYEDSLKKVVDWVRRCFGKNLVSVLDMVTDARILYDKADFFKGILEKLRMELNSLHAKRKRVGKKWYWDLKPDYRLGEEIRIE